jgi:hypothetical protein
MPTVTNTIKRPDGTAYAVGRVVIELAGENGRPLSGAYVTADDYTIESAYTIETLTAGGWSQELVANSLINPSGTAWRITEQIDGRSHVYYVDVPDGAGPYFVEDILSDAPGDIASGASVALAAHAADPAHHGWTPDHEARAFRPPTLIGNLSDHWLMLGFSTSLNQVLAWRQSNGLLYLSENGGSTFGGGKAAPSNTDAYAKAVYFNGYVYLTARTAVTLGWAVYRAPTVTGSSSFSWTKVFDLPAGSNQLQTNFSTDGTYLYLCDWGGVTGGPGIYRSSNGTSWTTTYSGNSALKHMHAIAADPYNPGHVYVSVGDQEVPYLPLPFLFLKSTDYGATWSVFGDDAFPQAVQISFDADRIWCATDNANAPIAFVMDRDGTKWAFVNGEFHQTRAVPGTTTGEVWDDNAYYGAVDPSTGIYYACTARLTGQAAGFWFVPYLGGPTVLYSHDAISGKDRASFGEPMFAFGNVFMGFHKFGAMSGRTIDV